MIESRIDPVPRTRRRRKLVRLAFVVLLVGGVFMLPPVRVGLRFARVYFGNLATRADWRVTGQARMASAAARVTDGVAADGSDCG